MKHRALPSLAILPLLIDLGCHGAAPPPAPQSPPRETSMTTGERFGAPLSPRTPLPTAVVVAEPQKYDGQVLALEGQVGAVCQRKGCWMTLGSGQPGSPMIRVSFKDYTFFVPKDSMGRKARVEGRFQVTRLSAAEARHYAEESGAAQAPVASEAARTLALVATGVEFVR